MCLTRPITIELPPKAIVYKALDLVRGQLQFPIYRTSDGIPVGVQLDAREYRWFPGIEYIEYEMSDGAYPNGFHTFRFLEDAVEYAGGQEVVYAAEASELTSCGELTMGAGRNEQSYMCYVSNKMKLLHLMK